MAEQRIVIEHDLRIERDDASFPVDNERIDLDERGVLLAGQLLHFGENVGGLRSDGLVGINATRNVHRFLLRKTLLRINGVANDLLRGLCRHLFDVDAARSGGDHDHAPRGAIEGHTEVGFGPDRRGLGDENFLHRPILDAQLEDFRRDLERLIGIVGQLDASRLPATTGVNLRFHDDAPAELARRFARLLGSVGDDSHRHRNPRRGEKLFPLILVKIHARTFPLDFDGVRREDDARPARYRSKTVSMIPRVERPGTSRTRTTLPPALSTASRPTISWMA